MPFPEKPDPNVCPKCGTTDCVPKAEVGVQGAGQLYIVGGSNALAKTCKFRQQLRAAGKIRINK